jgi:tol-pal system protein YbgF
VKRAAAALLVLLAVAGCATSGDVNVLARDVDALKRSSFETRKEVDAIKANTTGAVKEESFAAVRDSQAEIMSRVSEISSGLQELRGRFEESKYFTEKNLKDAAAEREILKTQIGNLEAQVKVLRDKMTAAGGFPSAAQQQEAGQGEASAPEPKEAGPSQKEGAAAKETSDEGARIYQSALQAFKDGKFKESREKFETFLKDNPSSPLADNAQFWIGETYYSEKDYEGAILAYEVVLKKYPSSSKTSGALLKQGYAFIEIGDAKTGKTILKKLIEKFPDSREAGLAKKRVAEIDRRPVKRK